MASTTANRVALLSGSTTRLIIFVGLPFWLIASAIRILTVPSRKPSILWHQAAIVATALIFYVVAMRWGWSRERAAATSLLQLAVLALFCLVAHAVLRLGDLGGEVELATIFDYLLSYAFGLALMVGIRNTIALREAQLERAALRASAMRSHLYALRMQMNPHFAFNTLNSISALLEVDTRRARKLLHSMSDLFRSTLAASKQEAHTLGNELAIANDYLTIQAARSDSRLRFEVYADTDTLRYQIPSLLLQPLVENAAMHGRADDRHTLRIWLRAWTAAAVGGQLRLWMEIGNQSSGPLITTERGGGYGLANTEERLNTRYGVAATLRLERPDVGTFVATLGLPATI